MFGITRSPIDFGAGSTISGVVTASHYSVLEGDVVTLTFENTSISGVVTADDYSVAEGDTVSLTFTADTYSLQWIDQNGNDVVGETATEIDWTSLLSDGPPRIRVTNDRTSESNIFTVNPLIVVNPAIGLMSYDDLGLTFDDLQLSYE